MSRKKTRTGAPPATKPDDALAWATFEQAVELDADRRAGARFREPELVLATQALNAALPSKLRRMVAARAPVIIVIEVPGEGWVSAVTRALKTVLRPAPDVMRSLKKSGGEDRVVTVVDAPVFAVAADLSNLSDESIAGADFHLRLTMTPQIYARALRILFGARATVRAGDLAGLDWRKLVIALRPDSATACVRRLRASSARLGLSSGVQHAPLLGELAGYGQVMERLKNLAEDLKDAKSGARITPLPSVILYGPPGTGKTTLARSLARTVNLPLVSTSIGDWFSGSGAHLGTVIGSARRFFEQVAASAPCLALIDELDALPNRARLDDRAREWWTPIVTTVLVGIDRMRARDARIVLVGATNHHDRLDPALLRPGRFDIHLEILGPATHADVEAILRHHLEGDLAGADLGLVARAGLAVGATGATLGAWYAPPATAPGARRAPSPSPICSPRRSRPTGCLPRRSGRSRCTRPPMQ